MPVYKHRVVLYDEIHLAQNPEISEFVRPYYEGEFYGEMCKEVTERKISDFVATLPEGVPYRVERIVRVRRRGRTSWTRTFSFYVAYGEMAEVQ